MRRRALAPILVVISAAVGCSSPADEPEVVVTTTSVHVASSTSAAPAEPSLDELAIATAETAVLDAGVIGADFVDHSRAEVVDLGDTLEVTLLPSDPDTIGATAVVILGKADLSVIDIRHYR